MGLLSERFGAVLATEWFLARVSSEVNLDVGFVEESSVADVTVVHHLLALITLTRRAGPSSSSSSSTAGAEQTLEEEKVPLLGS